MSDVEPRELWHRTAELVGVSFPDRTIELIVMPYETETIVPYQGRMVREVIARGAFDGIERRANRVRVNRDHQAERTVGRATTFHAVTPGRPGRRGADRPDRPGRRDADACRGRDPRRIRGVRADVPAGTGRDGRNTASTKAWLGHIAMTPDPAYVDAQVLAVRSADTAGQSVRDTQPRRGPRVAASSSGCGAV